MKRRILLLIFIVFLLVLHFFLSKSCSDNSFILEDNRDREIIKSQTLYEAFNFATKYNPKIDFDYCHVMEIVEDLQLKPCDYIYNDSIKSLLLDLSKGDLNIHLYQSNISFANEFMAKILSEISITPIGNFDILVNECIENENDFLNLSLSFINKLEAKDGISFFMGNRKIDSNDLIDSKFKSRELRAEIRNPITNEIRIIR